MTTNPSTVAAPVDVTEPGEAPAPTPPDGKGGTTPSEPPPWAEIEGIVWVPLFGAVPSRRWQNMVWWCGLVAALLVAFGLALLVPNSPLGTYDALLLAATGCPAAFFLVYGTGLVSLEQLRPQQETSPTPPSAAGARLRLLQRRSAATTAGTAALDLEAAIEFAKKVRDLTRALNPGRAQQVVGWVFAAGTIAAAAVFAGLEAAAG